MRKGPASFQWHRSFADAYPPIGCSSLIVVTTAAYLAIGLVAFVAWRITGKDAWVEQFFQVPSALLMVTLAAVELVFSLRVVREFSPGQPLRLAWQLIALSAGCDLAGAVASQLLSSSALNVLAMVGLGSGSLKLAIQQFGSVVGGSCRFILLAAGLFGTLRVYRRAGFLARLKVIDWIMLAGVGAYVLREARDLGVAMQHGKQPGMAEMLGWPVDLTLWLLLAEAMLLFRCVQQMGPGWIGRCWKAFIAGVVLVTLGDVAIWATNYGFLPWPWSALGWYLWLPAATAFALGPAYQLEAIYHARHARGSTPLESVS